LAGRSPRVSLDTSCSAQAAARVGRLSVVPLAAVITSPLLRCRQTVAPLTEARELAARPDPRLSEVDYGEWTGRELKTLMKEPLWRVVQQHPSAAVFP